MKKGQIPEVWKYRPDTVKPGDVLGIYHAERSKEGNNKIKVVKEDWKVVQVLQFYALCVNKKGTRKSLLYHELEEKTNPERKIREYAGSKGEGRKAAGKAAGY